MDRSCPCDRRRSSTARPSSAARRAEGTTPPFCRLPYNGGKAGGGSACPAVVRAAVKDDLAALATAIRACRLSPVDLVARCLRRIQATEPGLHAFIHVDGEGALAAARRREQEARRGEIRGPPHGIPIAVKDLFDQAGLPTTAGAAIRRSHRAAEHATAVRRLLDAGAVVIGKTNLHEFAFGVTSINPHFGD